jgi:hypothetical protein
MGKTYVKSPSYCLSYLGHFIKFGGLKKVLKMSSRAIPESSLRRGAIAPSNNSPSPNRNNTLSIILEFGEGDKGGEVSLTLNANGIAFLTPWKG